MPGRKTADHFARLLTYEWSPGRPNIGFVSESGGTIVGTFVGIYSTRKIGGQDVNLCNLSAWCVHPNFRQHSMALARTILAQTGLTFTAMSATPEAQTLWTNLKLTQLDNHKWITAPVSAGLWAITAKSTAIRLPSLPSWIGSEVRKLLADHIKIGFLAFTLGKGEDTCLLIGVKRRALRFSYFDVLYASDWLSLKTRLGLASATAWRCVGTPLLGIEGRHLHRPPLLSRKISRQSFFVSRTLTPQQIDGLYTEIALSYALPGDS